jgi:signal peptidase
MAEAKYTTPEQIEAMRQEIIHQKELRTGGPGLFRGKKQVTKLLGRIVFLAVLSLLVYALIMIQTVKSRGETPQILGYYLFSVESGSMEPTLNVGSIIVSRAVRTPEALEKNDIVTFKTHAGAVVTHRIIEVRTDETGKVSYQTKGDNPINSPDEELLTPDRVIARFVVKIPLT